MYLGTMGLNSLNHPKGAFLVTAIAAVVNIILDIVLIPIMGITGAALATLIAMTLNALVALILLSRVISVKIEHGPVKHILYASGIMGIFLDCNSFSSASHSRGHGIWNSPDRGMHLFTRSPQG